MASELRVNSSTNRSGLGTITYTDSGPIVSGVGTFTNGLTVDGTQTTVKSLKLTGDNYNANWFKTTNKLRFNDNAKATFGTADDLSIYHDGGNTRINNATGILNIQSDDFQITDASNTTTRFRVDADGPTYLRYNGSNKFETSNTGVTITGTAVAGALDISGDITHVGDSNTKFGFGGGDDTFRVITGGSTRLHIHTDGRFRVGCTAQPSGTVGGFQLDMGSYPGTLRLMSGAGASGTDSASLAVGGSNYHANLHNGANMGGKLDLYNYNSTDGNSTAVSFYNSNGLSIARILGVNISHSSRNGALVFMTSNAQYPTEKMRLDKDGNITFGITDTPTALTSAAIKYISGGRDYWNGTKGDYRALRLRVYDNGGNIDDQYGVGVSSGELELQSQQDIGFYAGSAGSTTGRRALRFRLDSSDDILIFETNTKLYLKGTANNPQSHASINIGSNGNASETRAIDIWGSWGAGENKSISFNHGSSTNELVGQINCIHTSPGSSMRWGKLYHAGNSNTYTMTLDSTSTTGANLTLTNGNLKVAAGHGIDFSATSDGNGTNINELFADYERGVHTFAVTGSGGNPTVSIQSGYDKLYYTKIGDMVHVTGEMRWTISSHGSGDLKISIPFTSDSTSQSNCQGTAQTWNVDWAWRSESRDLWSEVSPGATYMRFRIGGSDSLNEDYLDCGSAYQKTANSGYGVEYQVSIWYRTG